MKVLVRLCDKTYDEEMIKEAGIEVKVSESFIYASRNSTEGLSS